MSLDPISAALDLGGKILDKFVSDPAQRDAAKLALYNSQRTSELDEIKTSMSAIMAEASSSDPWTSRARPSFLYVVYILILSCLPMGILFAVSPETAQHVADGAKAWLSAIPSEIIELFKWVMLGYVGGRSLEKIKGIK